MEVFDAKRSNHNFDLACKSLYDVLYELFVVIFIGCKGDAKITNLVCIVWKFHDFSVTQILREIYFGRESRSSKTAMH